PPSGPSGTRRATRRSWSSRKVGKSESRKVGKRKVRNQNGAPREGAPFPYARLSVPPPFRPSDLPTFQPSSLHAQHPGRLRRLPLPDERDHPRRREPYDQPVLRPRQPGV